MPAPFQVLSLDSTALRGRYNFSRGELRLSSNKSPEASHSANIEWHQHLAVVHSFVLELQGQSKAMNQNQEQHKRQALWARGEKTRSHHNGFQRTLLKRIIIIITISSVMLLCQALLSPPPSALRSSSQLPLS